MYVERDGVGTAEKSVLPEIAVHIYVHPTPSTAPFCKSLAFKHRTNVVVTTTDMCTYMKQFGGDRYAISRTTISPPLSTHERGDVPLEKHYNKRGFSTVKRIQRLNIRYFIGFRHSQITSEAHNTCSSFTYRSARNYCPYTF